MATLHDGAPPRKKLVTYGKSARKRIPDYGFNSVDKPTLRDITPKPDNYAPASTAPPSTTYTTSKPLRHRSKTPALAPPPKTKAVGIPESDGESVVLVHKKHTTPPKPKAKPAAESPTGKASPPKSVYDLPESEEEAAKPAKKSPPTPKRRVRAKPPLKNPPKPAAAPVNIFDIPESEDDTPKVVRKTSPLRKPTPKLKGAAPLTSTITSPKSPVKRDIYDISSEEDVIVVTPRPTQTKQATSNLGARLKPVHTESISITDDGRRKKLKLSPEHELGTKPAPKTNAHSPKQKAKPLPKPTKQVHTSPKNKPIARMAMKVAQELPIRRQERPKTPLKSHPQLAFEETDLDMIIEPDDSADKMDLDQQSRQHMSPRAKELWQDILDSADDVENKSSSGSKMDLQMGSRTLQGTSSARLQAKLFAGTELSKPAQKIQSKAPRKRLIDTLVRQTEESDASESEETDSEESQPTSSPHVGAPLSPPRNQNAAPDRMVIDSQASQLPQVPGLRTYSRQRSLLQEADMMKDLALGLPSQPSESSRRHRRGSIPKLQPLSSFYEEEEEDVSQNLQSLHELRKAGAGTRFLNDVGDLIDTIGAPEKTPISLRRSGLVDLADKMKDKDFAKEFRAHSMELTLFVHLGLEKDVVAGFLMVSILVLMLSEGPMPHIVVHLRRQGITRLIIRQLECELGIASLCRDRKTNMSGSARSMIVDHHDSLLALPIWEDLEPQILSPRTLALKCLELMVRQTRAANNDSDLFSSKDLTTKLFTILTSASDEATWDLPQGKAAIDFYLALAILQQHSLAARTAHDEAIWVSDYLPILASTLEIACARPIETTNSIQLLLLKMSIQVTNENASAANVFARPSLFSVLGQTIVSRFQAVTKFLMENEFEELIQNLTLLVGFMMNVADTTEGREALAALHNTPEDPLNALIHTFNDQAGRVSLADDTLSTQRNVAFGWLSCMLGYFYLHPAIASRFRSTKPKLMESIREFIWMHKAADSQVMVELDGDEEPAETPSKVITDKLEELVGRLTGL